MKHLFFLMLLVAVLTVAGCKSTAEQPSKPNILFAIADDASWKQELYHIQHDPYCMVNLAGREEFSELKSEMKKRMVVTGWVNEMDFLTVISD